MIIKYKHSCNFQTYKRFTWIFNDSVKNDLDTNICYSYVKQRDVYNNYHYKGIYNIIVWEFKDLNISEFEKLSINQNVNLDNVGFKYNEVLNSKSDLEINIKLGFAFYNTLKVNLDKNSKIERNIESSNYKGFYGIINKMSFSTEKGEPQILFNYVNKRTPTVFLFYKGQRMVYVVIINSEKSFDEKIINILNLE